MSATVCLNTGEYRVKQCVQYKNREFQWAEINPFQQEVWSHLEASHMTGLIMLTCSELMTTKDGVTLHESLFFQFAKIRQYLERKFRADNLPKYKENVTCVIESLTQFGSLLRQMYETNAMLDSMIHFFSPPFLFYLLLSLSVCLWKDRRGECETTTVCSISACQYYAFQKMDSK